VETTEQPAVQALPTAFVRFMRDACRLPLDAFHALPGASLPAVARRLLDHRRDMTSTLADFHGSALRVEILNVAVTEEYYLREVFLRTTATDRVVEYGVLAVALAAFTTTQRAELTAGRTPRRLSECRAAPLGRLRTAAAAPAKTPPGRPRSRR
jgi:hypothetical protein